MITDPTMLKFSPEQVKRWGVAKKDAVWRQDEHGVIVNRENPHQKLRMTPFGWKGVK